MKTDKDLLKRDLLANGGCDKGVERALATLEPFFAIAESGDYPLGRGSCADVGGIATTLWHAGKLHARGCVFMAACIPHREPLWEPAPDHAFLYGRLRARYDGELTAALSNPRFEMAFGNALGDGLDAALRRSLKDAGALAQAPCGDTLGYALRAFTAFAAEGRREADALEPLVRLLPSFIPIVEAGREDDEGIWYVLSGT
ncbi:MAG TPA: hypothetical protein VL500_04230 [Candidatus Eisenbacteria bacterium]|jgi:hypothetical protein|nr:hypothetical protein [Candidatus Eisenbacteria bacterium]